MKAQSTFPTQAINNVFEMFRMKAKIQTKYPFERGKCAPMMLKMMAKIYDAANEMEIQPNDLVRGATSASHVSQLMHHMHV